MVAKVKGTASMVGGWKGWVKEEKMTGKKFTGQRVRQEHSGEREEAEDRDDNNGR